MADWNVLKDMLVSNLLNAISEQNGRHFAMLKETGSSAKLKRVDIYDVPNDSLLLNLESYKQPITLFNGKNGECRRCDYVLVTKVDGRNILLFVEMKSSIVSKSEIQQQFKGAECIIDYCDAALNRFHTQSDLLKQFEKRFIVFYRPRSISKRKTRPSLPIPKNDSSDKAYRYPAPHNPSLKSLIGL